jgi:hypothetical protein
VLGLKLESLELGKEGVRGEERRGDRCLSGVCSGCLAKWGGFIGDFWADFEISGKRDGEGQGCEVTFRAGQSIIMVKQPELLRFICYFCKSASVELELCIQHTLNFCLFSLAWLSVSKLAKVTFRAGY